MKIVQPRHEIITDISDGAVKELKTIERVARICYKSEGRVTEESYKDFVADKVKIGHHSVIEHSNLTVIFTVDRGVSHELVRHRIMSYAQESTRYCNYTKDKFTNEISVIKPAQIVEGTATYDAWKQGCEEAEKAYFAMIESGTKPEIARSVLPTCLKTEIVATGNYRSWRNILETRTTNAAHPQIREVMLGLLDELHDRIPVIFDDIWDRRIGYRLKLEELFKPEITD